MNILFFSRYFPDPLHGGNQRVTFRLATCLSRDFGHVCSVLYSSGDDYCDCRFPVVRVPETDGAAFVREYVSAHKVDIVVIQDAIEALGLFAGTDSPKIVYAYHAEPAGLFKSCTYDYVLHSLMYRELRPVWVKRLFTFPWMKLKRLLKTIADNERIVFNTDCQVLLSSRFISQFRHLCLHPGRASLYSISNPLSFDICLDAVPVKAKRILIVSRLEESYKRVIMALKIWKVFQENYCLDDWELVVVGRGPDEDLFRNYIAGNAIANVKLTGLCDPRSYYRDSALLMLTSVSEGFGMVLTECMQYGCIPVAFDSFAAVHDIIEDGVNGALVKYGDVRAFAARLYELAEDETARNRMAGNALASVSRFSAENVVRQWDELFRSLF